MCKLSRASLFARFWSVFRRRNRTSQAESLPYRARRNMLRQLATRMRKTQKHIGVQGMDSEGGP